jgi:hypothetical protein
MSFLGEKYMCKSNCSHVKKYNGWTNWDTWNAHLWLSNDEVTYKRLMNVIKVTKELDDVEKMAIYGAHLIKEMGNPDNITFKNVNWVEILKALQE